MKFQKDVIVILPPGIVVLSGWLEVVASLETKTENTEVKKFDNFLSFFQISYERMMETTFNDPPMYTTSN